MLQIGGWNPWIFCNEHSKRARSKVNVSNVSSPDLDQAALRCQMEQLKESLKSVQAPTLDLGTP